MIWRLKRYWVINRDSIVASQRVTYKAAVRDAKLAGPGSYVERLGGEIVWEYPFRSGETTSL